MLPATAVPAETPIPTSHCGTSAARRSRIVRAARSAAPAASSWGSGAPKTQSAASPTNLLTAPPSSAIDVDDDGEELVEQLDDLARRALVGQLGRADQVDEQHGDLALLAAHRDPALQRLAGDVLADLAAEQVAQLLALLEALDHAVEARLQQPDLAAVVDVDVRVRRRAARGAARARTASSGSASERAVSAITATPTTSAIAAEQQRGDRQAVRRGVDRVRQHARADEHERRGPGRPIPRCRSTGSAPRCRAAPGRPGRGRPARGPRPGAGRAGPAGRRPRTSRRPPARP